MLYHILAVGDVVMEPGLRHLERHLRPLQKWKAIDFTVVNGENAAELLDAGNVDGALVGGASLTAAKFVPIVEAAAAL